jgi:DNA relaxase NicK
MGLHIQWDGTSLDALSFPVLELVKFLYQAGAKFTRIDLAVDAQNFGLKASDATNEIRKKAFKCRCKKTPAWFDPTFGGWTQYLGTKASEIHLRIYDKAAELGIQGDYTRVELVVRGKRAQAAAIAIVRGTDFRSLVCGYVQFPEWVAWKQVMVADAVTLPAEKKETATDIWLLGQVAKAMARRLDELGDDELWFRFLDQVKANRIS